MYASTLNGQLVHEQLVNNMNRGETIELDLDNGIYFLEVNSGEKRSATIGCAALSFFRITNWKARDCGLFLCPQISKSNTVRLLPPHC